MKANELSVGDFVDIGYRPTRVLSVSSDGLVSVSEVYEEISIGCLKPIPITTEILGKNGFKLQERTHIQDFENWVSEDTRIEINHLSNMQDRDWSIHIDNELYESIGCVDIEYVHELQHVLRLCNIDKEIEL